MRLSIVGAVSAAPLDFSASENMSANLTSTNTDLSTFSRFTLGAMVLAAPTMAPDTTASVPNWGVSELVFVKSALAATTPGRLVTLDKDWGIADLANTANLGRPVYVTLTNFSAGTTIPQVGWVMRAGVAPVQYAVAATAGALFIGAAGQATPTAANGKQLLNAVCTIAAAGSFTRTVRTVNGSKVLIVADSRGMFIGQAVTGTGIAASSTIAAIARDGLSISLNNAATASGSVTGTFTHTGFGIVHFDRPFAQGQAV